MYAQVFEMPISLRIFRVKFDDSPLQVSLILLGPVTILAFGEGQTL
jgi:hypothetical protein